LNAVRIHAAGAIDGLRYENCEEPQLERPTDVIVKLVATAVNRLDLELRAGANGRFSFPHILGCDGAGRIEAVGAEVGHLKPGDPVCVYPFVHCGSCQFCAVKEYDRCADRRILSQCEDGTYAEYITVPANSCFPIPFGFSFEEAAAFPLVYTTAWRLMMTQGKLIPGEIVLIRGVGGGIATAARQIAASAGARIIVSSAKDEKLARVKALGFELAVRIGGGGPAQLQEARQLSFGRKPHPGRDRNQDPEPHPGHDRGRGLEPGPRPEPRPKRPGRT